MFLKQLRAIDLFNHLELDPWCISRQKAVMNQNLRQEMPHLHIHTGEPNKRNLQLIDLERFSLLALIFCEINNKLSNV